MRIVIRVSRAAVVDNVFRALSDPTRRAVVARLTRRPASVTELAEPFAMALPSFVQHLGVLESSGVVRSKKTGRVRTYELVPKRLLFAENWLAAQREQWEQRMDQFATYVEEMDDDKTHADDRRTKKDGRR
jgi:DNA-binding transcriptional ArsR family regulator